MHRPKQQNDRCHDIARTQGLGLVRHLGLSPTPTPTPPLSLTHINKSPLATHRIRDKDASANLETGREAEVSTGLFFFPI